MASTRFVHSRYELYDCCGDLTFDELRYSKSEIKRCCLFVILPLVEISFLH